MFVLALGLFLLGDSAAPTAFAFNFKPCGSAISDSVSCSDHQRSDPKLAKVCFDWSTGLTMNYVNMQKCPLYRGKFESEQKLLEHFLGDNVIPITECDWGELLGELRGIVSTNDANAKTVVAALIQARANCAKDKKFAPTLQENIPSLSEKLLRRTADILHSSGSKLSRFFDTDILHSSGSKLSRFFDSPKFCGVPRGTIKATGCVYKVIQYCFFNGLLSRRAFECCVFLTEEDQCVSFDGKPAGEQLVERTLQTLNSLGIPTTDCRDLLLKRRCLGWRTLGEVAIRTVELGHFDCAWTRANIENIEGCSELGDTVVRVDIQRKEGGTGLIVSHWELLAVCDLRSILKGSVIKLRDRYKPGFEKSLDTDRGDPGKFSEPGKTRYRWIPVQLFATIVWSVLQAECDAHLIMAITDLEKTLGSRKQRARSEKSQQVEHGESSSAGAAEDSPTVQTLTELNERQSLLEATAKSAQIQREAILTEIMTKVEKESEKWKTIVESEQK